MLARMSAASSSSCLSTKSSRTAIARNDRDVLANGWRSSRQPGSWRCIAPYSSASTSRCTSTITRPGTVANQAGSVTVAPSRRRATQVTDKKDRTRHLLQGVLLERLSHRELVRREKCLRSALPNVQARTPPRSAVVTAVSDRTAILRGRRVLVTGASGFVGRAVCERLVLGGVETVGVSRRAAGCRRRADRAGGVAPSRPRRRRGRPSTGRRGAAARGDQPGQLGRRVA